MFGLSPILAEMPDCLKLDFLASRRRWLQVGKRSCNLSCNAAWVLATLLLQAGVYKGEQPQHCRRKCPMVLWLSSWQWGGVHGFISSFKKIFWREKRNSILPIFLRVGTVVLKIKLIFPKLQTQQKSLRIEFAGVRPLPQLWSLALNSPLPLKFWSRFSAPWKTSV